MRKICFEEGLSLSSFKIMILAELLQILLLVTGFIYGNMYLFWTGIALNAMEIIVFAYWLRTNGSG